MHRIALAVIAVIIIVSVGASDMYADHSLTCDKLPNGTGFVAGVTVTSETVSDDEICNFLEGGPFGGPGSGGVVGGGESECIAMGGRWVNGECQPPRPDPRHECQAAGGKWVNGACHFTFPGTILSSIVAAAERRAAAPGPTGTAREGNSKSTRMSVPRLEATTFMFKGTRIIVFLKPGYFRWKSPFRAVVGAAPAPPYRKPAAQE